MSGTNGKNSKPTIPKEQLEELNLEYKKAVSYFKKHSKLLFDEHEAEDFASWVMEKRLKKRKATLKQLLTDYFRLNIIDRRIYKEVFPRFTYELTRKTTPSVDYTESILQTLEIENIFGLLSDFEARILRLHFYDGLSYQKIALKLDVAEYAVSHMMKSIIEKVRSKLGGI